MPGDFQLAYFTLLEKGIRRRQLLISFHRHRELILSSYQRYWQHSYGHRQCLHLGLDSLRRYGDLVEVAYVMTTIRGWTVTRHKLIEEICEVKLELVEVAEATVMGGTYTS